MSALPLATYNSPGNPIYAPLPISVSSLRVSTITANNLTASSISTSKLSANSTISAFIEGTYGEYSNWYVDTKLFVNFQELTADADQLFLNGIPLATTSDISNIEDWSLYAQVSTLDGNNQDIRATNFLEANRISVSTLGASNATLTTIVGSNATFTNLFTQNLMAFNIVNFTSTVIEVYESTIQSDIKLANISTANISNGTARFSTLNAGRAYISSLSTNTATVNTLNAGTGIFGNFTASSITVSSIVSPGVPNGVFSTITVAGNTTTNSFNEGGGGATFATTATFNNGANFNGARANLNSGFTTSGTAYFNNQTICNLATVSNSNTALNLIVDASTNTSTYPTINLQSKFGGGGIVNITADSPSIFVVVPTQQVNIRAKGGVGYVSGIPVGGAINLTADAGTSNAITPTGVLANGAIRLTANSFINGAFTVPGLILQSAGSISAYSGLTSPVAGVYGCSFYSALTTLSLTCGVSPVTTSFPGVVYLRGDNGTKVVNGFYADTINNNVGYDLDIRSKTIDISNRNINIDSASNVSINTSNGGQLYINGTPYSGGGGGGSFVSTATSDLNMSSFSILGSNAGNSLGNFKAFKFIYEPPTASGQSAEFSIQAHPQDAGVIYDLRYGVDLDGGYGYLYCEWTGYIVVPMKISGQVVYIGDGEGVVLNTNNYINNNTQGSFTVSSQTIDIKSTGDINIRGANIALSNVSSINGVPYSTGGGSWVGTASSDLDMNGYQIKAPSLLLISTPFLYLNTPIVCAISTNQFYADVKERSILTVGSTIYTAQSMTSTNIDFLQAGPGGYIRRNAQGNIIDTAGGNIQTQAVSTINTVPETVFTGDVLVSSFKQTLIGTAVPQPVIQYGVVSSSGSSGSVVVSMPTRYTTQQSYVPFACMADAPPAQTYVSTNNRGAFTIGWSSGGSGVHYFNWQTMGT